MTEDCCQSHHPMVRRKARLEILTLFLLARTYGPGDEPSNAGSYRGRRLIEGISPVRNRGLIEATLKNEGYENRDFMRPKMEQ